jgi:hypothetical protein
MTSITQARRKSKAILDSICRRRTDGDDGDAGAKQATRETNMTYESKYSRAVTEAVRCNRARVDPIRLGVGRKSAISLDTGRGPDGLPIDPPAANLALQIDWRSALREAGFTEDEAELFNLTHVAACPSETARSLMRWRPAKYASVSISLRAKLPARLEALREAISKQREDALPTVDSLYAEVMADERLSIVGYRLSCLG